MGETMSGRNMGRSWLLDQVAVLVGAACLASSVAFAEQPRAKIVGLGATSCAQFLSDAGTMPAVQRDYLAWAQGFMSAILLSRPAGIDEHLDLLPPALPLLKQLRFLQERCTASPESSFSDAVEALYKRLRQAGGVEPRSSK